MSHLTWQRRGLRSAAVALLSSVCLISCVAAAAQASPQHQAAATQPTTTLAPTDFTAGGWKLDNHWTYDEVLANKAMTTTIASVPEIAHLGCAGLSRIPWAGPFLAGFCSVHLQWARNVAGKALEQGRCFRWVIPGHQLGLTYPTTYEGGWCR
jgi:hypothetical protein